MELTCPKCHGAMRTYERNGVHVDQCADCRGIFLDRGELDRLIDAENAWHGGTSAPAAADDRRQEPRATTQQPTGGQLGSVVDEVLRQVRGSSHGTRDQRSDGRYDERHDPRYDQRYGGRRKKESFLSDLFG
ncbi:zf-TFIIB domain-containing protein [Blastococcus sp. TF02A-30]|uniref:TFIIB-type zinc ribbon-containing protein n=1 Tax=Blastococcus sp. TF02A-30 TaxID=2250580 RepID=UPI000DEA9FC1|nr:zf-TFIIB domain-containing protein [Blastococcus sp. TF02A-30]RBY87851.1 hypothetical protein DQ241_11395 [Blastococcus sp. TF02A-30]